LILFTKKKREKQQIPAKNENLRNERAICSETKFMKAEIYRRDDTG